MTTKTNHLEVIVKNIPDPLKKYDQWIGWIFEEIDEGKLTKVPKHIVKGYKASSKRPEDWVSFRTCMKHYDKFDGIGFVTNKSDPVVIWDLDDCCNINEGWISEKAKKIIRQLKSYTEYSPSGKGIRIIVKGTIGPLGRRNNAEHIEVYDGGQYLTITGHHVQGTPKVIRTKTKICSDLHEKYLETQIKMQ